jgi:hypothetical protein
MAGFATYYSDVIPLRRFCVRKCKTSTLEQPTLRNSSFVVLVADVVPRIRVLRFLLLGWTPHAIAADCHIAQDWETGATQDIEVPEYEDHGGIRTYR